MILCGALQQKVFEDSKETFFKKFLLRVQGGALLYGVFLFAKLFLLRLFRQKKKRNFKHEKKTVRGSSPLTIPRDFLKKVDKNFRRVYGGI